MKLLIIVVLLFAAMSCNDQYDGMILTDTVTHKQYQLIFNAGDTYFIHEKKPVISGADTSWAFKK